MIYAAYDSISIDRNPGPKRLIFSIEPSRRSAQAGRQKMSQARRKTNATECAGRPSMKR